MLSDFTLLGMAGSATVAIITAAVFVIKIAIGIGKHLHRSEHNDKTIDLIPGLCAEITSIKSMISPIIATVAKHDERLDKYHSNITELRLKVGIVEERQSQGEYGA